MVVCFNPSYGFALKLAFPQIPVIGSDTGNSTECS